MGRWWPLILLGALIAALWASAQVDRVPDETPRDADPARAGPVILETYGRAPDQRPGAADGGVPQLPPETTGVIGVVRSPGGQSLGGVTIAVVVRTPDCLRPRTLVSATADARGRFAVPVRTEHAEGRYEIKLRRPGWYASRLVGDDWRGVPFVPVEGQGVAVAATMYPADVVTGVVVDQDGAPVAGARVELRGALADPDFGTAFRFDDASYVTWSDGGFRFRVRPQALGERELSLRVTADGYHGWLEQQVERQLDGGRAELRIELDRGSVLAGRVLDPGGRPVPEVPVEVHTPTSTWSGTTDEQGAFAASPLEPGEHTVVARDLAGLRLARARVVLDQTTADVDVVLERVDLPPDPSGPLELGGYRLLPLTERVREAFALPDSFGLLVISEARGQADPLVRGDIVVGIGDEPIAEEADVRARVGALIRKHVLGEGAMRSVRLAVRGRGSRMLLVNYLSWAHPGR